MAEAYMLTTLYSILQQKSKLYKSYNITINSTKYKAMILTVKLMIYKNEKRCSNKNIWGTSCLKSKTIIIHI